MEPTPWGYPVGQTRQPPDLINSDWVRGFYASAVLVMRAAAAYSTAIKNTSDMMRHSLRIEKTIDDTDKELPELVIKELTSDEIEEMRRVGVDEEEEEALA